MSNPTQRVREALKQENDGDRLAPAVLDGSEVVAALEEHGDLRGGDSWGPWSWNEELRTLDYTADPWSREYPYRVRVGEILDAEDPDDKAWTWVHHVAEKRWEPPSVRCLVFALIEILEQKFGPWMERRADS